MHELEAILGPYAYRAYRYAERVVDGEIPACKWVRLACERHLNDLMRTDTDWTYSPEKANHICAFIESLPHVKGDWARRGETIKLEDWQCFMLAVPFGYVYKYDVIEPETGVVIARAGTRRFRVVYVEVPRKNAKSTITAGIGLYLLREDDEAGAEVYSAATKRDQAKIVFDTARQMARRTNLGLSVFAHNISYLDTASKFEPLHSEGSTMDGLNISGALNDELHAWKRRDVYDVIETAMGSRSNPMLWNITTAGTNIEGLCYQTRGYLTKILEGVLEDDNFFGLIYTIDEGDDWQEEGSWKKANPNYGISVSPLDMRRLAKKAAEIASEQSAFQTKRLDVWCNAATNWMNLIAWDRMGDPSLTLDDFRGEDCWLGVDLASKNDLAALAIIFKRQLPWTNSEGKTFVRTHYFLFVKHYLPAEAVKKAANAAHYDGWVRRKLITVTPGSMLDVDTIERDTKEIAKNHNIVELGFDPAHNSTQYGINMMDEGIEVIEVRPTVLNFSDPMKWMQAMVVEGVFHHAGCPVLTWEASNTVCRQDAKDNIYPRKEFEERKIDGIVAALVALNRAMVGEDASHTGELKVV